MAKERARAVGDQSGINLSRSNSQKKGKMEMWIHNPTCGCAECGNYGQSYNPRAIHNQSCGCAECGNYGNTAPLEFPAFLRGRETRGDKFLRGLRESAQNPAEPSPVSDLIATEFPNPATYGLATATIEFVKSCGATCSDSDRQILAESFEFLIARIDASVAPSEQKQEVRDFLKKFMLYPLAVEELVDLEDQIRKLFGNNKE